MFDASFTRLLEDYATKSDTELEFRFQINNDRTVYKNILNSINGTKTIEQSINFMTTGQNETRINKLLFVNGVKQHSVYMSKSLIGKSHTINGVIPYKLVLSQEKTIPKFDVNICKMARIKLRISIRPPELPDWRFDLTLVKAVADIKANLKKSKDNMLFEITAETFVELAPWKHAESLEFEAEHISDDKIIHVDELKQLVVSTFNLISPNYTNMMVYQDKVYQIASYMMDKKKLEQFKHGKSARDLYNRVLELNKTTYYRTVFPKITDYYVLHKADGTRNIVIFEGKTMYALNGGLKTIDLTTEHKKVTIIDTEFIDGKYYIFDVLVANGTSVINEHTPSRVSHIPNIIGMSEGNVHEKTMIPLTSNFRQEIRQLFQESKELPYDIDGLILTPKNETYTDMKSWKWKPLSHMSIDFLVKKPPQHLVGVIPYINKPGHTILFLFSGINRQLYDKLRMAPVVEYKKMFPHQTMYKHFPIQFSPSDDPYAYIYYHPNDNPIGLDSIIDNVCEFRRINLDTEPVWDVMKVRSDRKIDLDRGNYFGNSFYVAEYTWQNYISPLNFDDLVISNTEFMDVGYFQEEKATMYRASTGFNSFVKTKLLSKYIGSDWIIDIAGGRGADMFRISDAKISNAIFVDSSPQALSELVSKKHDFQRGIKKLNTKIYTKLMDLNDPYEKNIQSLQRMGIPIGTLDVAMCNFAIHYLVGTPDNVRNLIRFIYAVLKPGGHFFMTTFNGRYIFDLLGENKAWESKEGDVVKYGIKKLYSSETLTETGQKISVMLPFSGSNYYEEYLVNFDYLRNEFELNRFNTVKTGDFKSFIPRYKAQTHSNSNLTDKDIEYVSLLSYIVFKKTR
jgi:SAM-dependent methyltransferase